MSARSSHQSERSFLRHGRNYSPLAVVLAAATPSSFGDPCLVDETLDAVDPLDIQAGDVVGIGIHTANALRGYEIGKMARERGADVVFGGIHATLYPAEAHELGGAHAVVKGDGDVAWAKVLADCEHGTPQLVYEGGRIEASEFLPARWDLVPRQSYMWASVQTVRGCPKHCSFCSVWRTDGGARRGARFLEVVVEEKQYEKKKNMADPPRPRCRGRCRFLSAKPSRKSNVWDSREPSAPRPTSSFAPGTRSHRAGRNSESLDAASFVNQLRRSADAIRQYFGPGYISIAFDHSMRAAEFMRFGGIESPA